MQEPKYKVGQVWNYKARDGEEGSRVFIVLAEPHEKLGGVYHVFVDRLKLRNPDIESGIQTELPHSPVAEQTLEASVTTLAIESASELPDISEGYEVWKENNGGFWDVPIAEIVQILEDAANGNLDEA